MTVQQFVDYQLRIAAGPYRYGSWDCRDRCNPESSGCADCSGIFCSALRHAGYPDYPCLGSFALSRECHRAGASISIWEARRTYGAPVFLGRNEGQGMLDGSADGIWSGHVATSLGDGRVVEARNHAVGILISDFDYRYWTYGARPFWFASPPPPDPVPAPPARSKEEPDVIYLHNPGKPPNQQPCVFLDPAHLANPSDLSKRQMVAHYGGSIAWEGGSGDSTEHPTGTKNVQTIGIPGPKNERIVAVVMIPGTMAADRSHCDIVAISSAAAQRRGRAHI